MNLSTLAFSSFLYRCKLLAFGSWIVGLVLRNLKSRIDGGLEY